MPLAMPKAILFDMDDTILADSAGVERCWRAACQFGARRNASLDAADLYREIETYRQEYWSDPVRHRLGRLDLHLARRKIVTEALHRLNVDDPALALQIASTYATRRERLIQPFPGALDTLRSLRGRGLRLALLTNGNARSQRRKIEQHALAEHFACILIEGEFGAGKPDPRVYRHACGLLDLEPADTWMVGDNLEWEVAAPQRLGITGIWHDFAHVGLPPDAPVRPDAIISALPELLALIPG